ncbi:uncharacterized protein CEXT_748301 [Caerostris extrusa]|uniref:Uncharacterized protein n=1 Tax=Caerostris extrusa TaxID=172846 RepID=A0AAV4X6Z4_CAEEX|nr:uncharacterized protein CEXT_748301 [Caerostris extrusa]
MKVFPLPTKKSDLSLLYGGEGIQTTDNFTYLGVTFDRKLSWKLHSKTIINKASSRLPILKRLAAGCRWGCSRSTHNTTYKTFVLPVITYCCEPLIRASKQVRKSLETFHNQELHLIIGTVKTSPIDAMLLCTGNWPLEKIIEEKALVLWEKILRTPRYLTLWNLRAPVSAV